MASQIRSWRALAGDVSTSEDNRTERHGRDAVESYHDDGCQVCDVVGPRATRAMPEIGHNSSFTPTAAASSKRTEDQTSQQTWVAANDSSGTGELPQGVAEPGMAVESPEIVTVASTTLGEDDADELMPLIVAPLIESR